MFLGLVAGMVRGGKLRNISVTTFKSGWLAVAGLAMQIGAEAYASLGHSQLREARAGIWILAASYAFLIIFVIVNVRLPGMAFIGLGLALNLAVIIPNQGMPVSLKAASAAGFHPSGYLATALKHRAMGPQTVLSFLGDIIPIPPLHKVVSGGDISLSLGIFALVQATLKKGPVQPRHSEFTVSGP